VLRECARVLRPGGLLAVVAIESPPGLIDPDRSLAAELGPTNVHAPGSLPEMVAAVGLEAVHIEDWTATLRTTATATLAALAAAADSIRTAEGDEVYEEERGKKSGMVEGVDRGLLVRTLVIGRRASGG